MESLKIIALAIAAACTYGIVHDQITTRICVEYFTVGHPNIFGTDNPTLLGIGWGIVATWWVGAILGIPLAYAARRGKRPPRSAVSLLRPLGILLAVMGVCAALAGIIGWALARAGVVRLFGWIARTLPPERHVAFITDLWIHNASYAVGFIGGVVLIIHVWRTRTTAPVRRNHDTTDAAV